MTLKLSQTPSFNNDLKRINFILCFYLLSWGPEIGQSVLVVIVMGTFDLDSLFSFLCFLDLIFFWLFSFLLFLISSYLPSSLLDFLWIQLSASPVDTGPQNLHYTSGELHGSLYLNIIQSRVFLISPHLYLLTFCSLILPLPFNYKILFCTWYIAVQVQSITYLLLHRGSSASFCMTAFSKFPLSWLLLFFSIGTSYYNSDILRVQRKRRAKQQLLSSECYIYECYIYYIGHPSLMIV